MLVKHILDSLMNGPHLQGERFIDVGTGAGLPGIPLAILYPERQFVLLDSLGKRITFLKQVVYQLKLDNVTPLLSRVEKYQPEQPFDGVLSRAFASLTDMITWCKHLTDENGRFYALKGVYPEQELQKLPPGIELVTSYVIAVPELTGERHLIELKKV
jgi:16S rRNA (guanine527-N7)-methyltransferase